MDFTLGESSGKLTSGTHTSTSPLRLNSDGLTVPMASVRCCLGICFICHTLCNFSAISQAIWFVALWGLLAVFLNPSKIGELWYHNWHSK